MSVRVFTGGLPMKRPALFLDRDGVINIDKKFVYRRDEFEFIDGIFELTRRAQERGFLLLVITNQSGIGRGYYTEEIFEALSQWMMNRFAEEGVIISKVYYCPFHPEATLQQYRCDSADRKPNPGMIINACNEFDIELKDSILIGDKERDTEAGRRAGVGRCVLLMSEGNAESGSDEIVFGSLNEISEFLFDSY